MKDWIPEVAGRPWIDWKVTGLLDEGKHGEALVDYRRQERSAGW